VSIPNYHWYVSVNDGLLRAGGPLNIRVVPVSYDLASGTKRPMAVAEDELEVVLEPNSRPGGEMLVANAGYYASDGSRGNLVVHLRALGPAVPEPPDAPDTAGPLTRTGESGPQSLVKRTITFVDGPAGRAVGAVIGASSALSGVAAITDGGFGSLIAGVGMLAMGALILLGVTDKGE